MDKLIKKGISNKDRNVIQKNLKKSRAFRGKDRKTEGA